MSTNQYGPDKPCQRVEDSRCATFGPHLGGAHIDPRHELYDGPHTTLGALPQKARTAAYALLRASAPMPEVVDMAWVIHDQRDQIGHLMVDKDRSVRAASARALDCTEHGKVIADLEKSLHHFDDQARRNDRGRIAALGLLHQINKALAAMETRKRLGQPLPSSEEWVKALTEAAKKTSAAHDRAMKS